MDKLRRKIRVKTILISLSIPFFLLGLISCGGSPEFSLYNSKGIAFEYPSDWKLSQEIIPLPLITVSLQEICRLDEPNGGIMGILFSDIPKDMTAGDFIQSAYNTSSFSAWKVENFQELKETRGGKDFWVIKFQVPSFNLPTQFKNWWWEFQGKVFLFTLIGESEEFSAIEGGALKVLETFSVNPEEFHASFTSQEILKGNDYVLALPKGWRVKRYPLTDPAKNPQLGTIIIWEASRNDPFQLISFQELDFSGITGVLKSLNLQDHFKLAYLGFESKEYYFQDVQEEEIQIGDLKALVKIYTHPWGEPWRRTEDVWFEVNKKIYIISFSTHPQDFDSLEEGFREILSSIQWTIKPEEKPTEEPTESSPTPSGTPTITNTPTSPMETETPSEIGSLSLTARQAYSLIELEILREYPEAKLCGIFAGKFQTGEPINPDGTCLSWEFWFLASGKKISVEVVGGKPLEVTETNFKGTDFIPLPENWLDSPEVIEIALQEFQRLHQGIKNISPADQGLLYEAVPISGKGKIPSACLYISTGERYPYLVILDAATGEFLKESKM